MVSLHIVITLTTEVIMWTKQYKGYYIHGYSDKNDCTVHIFDTIFHVKSYRAAQLLITKHIKLTKK